MDSNSAADKHNQMDPAAKRVQFAAQEKIGAEKKTEGSKKPLKFKIKCGGKLQTTSSSQPLNMETSVANEKESSKEVTVVDCNMKNKMLNAATSSYSFKQKTGINDKEPAIPSCSSPKRRQSSSRNQDRKQSGSQPIEVINLEEESSSRRFESGTTVSHLNDAAARDTHDLEMFLEANRKKRRCGKAPERDEMQDELLAMANSVGFLCLGFMDLKGKVEIYSDMLTKVQQSLASIISKRG